jgi:quinol monooxygenase YgiN
MIKRIVKMVFRTEATDAFLHIFDSGCDKIRKSEGCHFLELVRDKEDSRIFFTISVWENEAALQAYRESELFRSTWAATKLLFDDAPKAWTTEGMRFLGINYR